MRFGPPSAPTSCSKQSDRLHNFDPSHTGKVWSWMAGGMPSVGGRAEGPGTPGRGGVPIFVFSFVSETVCLCPSVMGCFYAC